LYTHCGRTREKIPRRRARYLAESLWPSSDLIPVHITLMNDEAGHAGETGSLFD
jgi:hypothetical protein